MSQNNLKNNITTLHDSKNFLSPYPDSYSKKTCEETGEFYDKNLFQKPVKKNKTDQYFKAFGAGGGCFKKK
ncbi:MAG: hypothetical protein ACRCZ0_05745 [Cetobacterium sp.]